jgi:hypothetical protein
LPPTATLTPDVARVKFKSDLVNARAGGYVEACEVKPPTALASLENDIGERSYSHTTFA